jgi:hypothetical protein
MTAVAALIERESMELLMGMATRRSRTLRTEEDKPLPSLPTKRAKAWLGSVAEGRRV